MEWYAILLIVFAALAGVYIIVSLIVASKCLDAVTVVKGRTWEESRQFQIDCEHWDFDDFDNVWDKHLFEVVTKDNFKLYCMYINNPNATLHNNSNKVAIVPHGHICNLIQSVKYADIFYKQGYNIVLYDQRYFGKSEGYNCTLAEKETQDLALIIDKTKEIFGQDSYIALHGESMAGACVLNVLATNSKDIAYVVADCPFADSMTLYKQLMRSKFPTFPAMIFARMLAKIKYDYNIAIVSPIKVVSTVDTPICYIHGTADKLILPSHSERLYKATRNREQSELHLFDNALHARSHMLDRQQYIQVVTNFINKIEGE